MVSGCTKSHVRIFSSFTVASAQAFSGLCPLLTCSWGTRNDASARAATTRAARSCVSMGGSPPLRAMILSVDGSTESHLQRVAGPLIFHPSPGIDIPKAVCLHCTLHTAQAKMYVLHLVGSRLSPAPSQHPHSQQTDSTSTCSRPRSRVDPFCIASTATRVSSSSIWLHRSPACGCALERTKGHTWRVPSFVTARRTAPHPCCKWLQLQVDSVDTVRLQHHRLTQRSSLLNTSASPDFTFKAFTSCHRLSSNLLTGPLHQV